MLFMKQIFKISSFVCISLALFLSSKSVFAFNTNQEIYINQPYDSYQRYTISTVEIKPTSSAIFYADKEWWNKLSSADQSSLLNKLYIISTEFEYKIKPTLNRTFGQESKPISGTDTRLRIVLTPMLEGVQGYIRTSDFVLKTSNKTSNEGNIIYLNGNKIKTVSDNIAFSFISHEFMHLISYNQKYKIRGVNEDVWLEELRAEYAPTLIGYNDDWDNSYFKIRVTDFFNNNSISFVDWDNSNPNYSSVNLFGVYLLEQYGQDILLETLNSSKTGVESLNEFLAKKGENFNQVFQNWIIANILNDCTTSSRYCYQNTNLKKLSIMPASFYLPMNSNSALAISDTFVPYMVKYQKISGGSAYLNLDFENTPDNLNKRIPYIIINKDGSKRLFFLEFQNNKSQKIVIPDFNKEAIGLVLIPYLIRDDRNFSNRSIFKWSVQAGQGAIAPNADPDVIVPPTTKPNNPSQNISNSWETQQLIITLQSKLISLLLELMNIFKAKLGI